MLKYIIKLIGTNLNQIRNSCFIAVKNIRNTGQGIIAKIRAKISI
jgi:hypothetical protein